MATKRSHVHPKYKTKYRVANWPDYERALVARGNAALWLSPAAIAGWNAAPSARRGAQTKYSNLAIETVLTIRLAFRLPLRQAEGFVRTLFRLMQVPLDVPDHTTLARRARTLISVAPPVRPESRVHIVIDSTGLAIHSQGEWAAFKHGKKTLRAWRKLHLAVAHDGLIVAQELTESTYPDAWIGTQLLTSCPSSIASVTADAAYDTQAFYRAAAHRDATIIVPPRKNAITGRGSSKVRDRTIRRVRQLGRREWEKESGYRRQALAENAVFRFKTILGARLRARSLPSQRVEVALGCRLLNTFTALGLPVSIALANSSPLPYERPTSRLIHAPTSAEMSRVELGRRTR